MNFKERILDRIIKDPYVLVFWFFKYSGLSYISDYIFLKTHWHLHMGYKLNLKKPRSFSEKLQWIKLYDRNPIYSLFVDKYEVKQYVNSVLGSGYTIDTIGLWNNPQEINFDNLPNKFVLKCTHDSGSIVICKDKRNFDKKAAIQKLNEALKRNYYRLTREWPYKNVRPRIIAEPFLSELSSTDLIDYKFFCFNGRAKYCQVIKDRSTKESIDFFDMNWNRQEFIGLNPSVSLHSIAPIEKPKNFDKMVSFANLLSRDIPFVRVDFYNLNGKIYFGELTFFPANGMGQFTPEEWNLRIGDMLNLPV